MKKTYLSFALFLVFSLLTTSIFGQQNCIADNESYCPAYVQSSHSAHWTVYIPLAIIVGGAIYFGLCDQKKTTCKKYDSQDGLGRMDSPKRQISDLPLLRSKTMIPIPFNSYHSH